MVTPHAQSNLVRKPRGKDSADGAAWRVSPAEALRYNSNPLGLLSDFPRAAERRRIVRQIEAELIRLEQQQSAEQARWVSTAARRHGGFNALRTARSAAAHA